MGMMEVGPGWSGWSGAQPEMVGVSASVNLPLTIKFRSSLLAPAHPGGPGNRRIKGHKTVVELVVLLGGCLKALTIILLLILSKKTPKKL